MSLKPMSLLKTAFLVHPKKVILLLRKRYKQIQSSLHRNMPPLHEMPGSVAVQIENTEAREAAGQMFVTVRSGRDLYTQPRTICYR
jgi:hypothetical protein